MAIWTSNDTNFGINFAYLFMQKTIKLMGFRVGGDIIATNKKTSTKKQQINLYKKATNKLLQKKQQINFWKRTKNKLSQKQIKK